MSSWRDSTGRHSSWAAWLSLLLLAVAAALSPLLAGCSDRESIHPALRVEDDEFEKAVERGRTIAATGGDPYRAYSFSTQQVNLRVSPDVIVREAACCWPKDEIAFLIAKQANGDASAVDRIAKQVRDQVERDLKFTVLIQMPTTRDPNTAIQFAMRSSAGAEYPPLAVEQPVFIREVSTALDPEMPPSAIYEYDVHFPIQGSPGYPKLGPEITGLTLIVKDGDAEASVPFAMPTQKPRY
ncbi:MAG: hypothetical protein ABSD48_01540 [Armatimonadota bacterium]